MINRATLSVKARQAQIEALRHTEPSNTSAGHRPRAAWRDDDTLLAWLASL